MIIFGAMAPFSCTSFPSFASWTLEKKSAPFVLVFSLLFVQSLFAVGHSTRGTLDSSSWHPLERSLSDPMVLRHASNSATSSTADSFIEWSAYGTVQYSPGARLQGRWVQLPTAGGVGWVTGLDVFGKHHKLTWQANLDHWRVAGGARKRLERSMAMGCLGWNGARLEPQRSRHRCAQNNRSSSVSSEPFSPTEVRTRTASLGSRMEVLVDGPASLPVALREPAGAPQTLGVHPPDCANAAPWSRQSPSNPYKWQKSSRFVCDTTGCLDGGACRRS